MVSKPKLSKSRLLWLGLGLIGGGVIGFVLALQTGAGRVIFTEAKPALATDAAHYPVTIPAQRARRYPGGAIKVEQELGEQGGYRLSRISYPSDGLRIYALMATPSSPRPVFGYPAVILVHGYVNPAAYRTTGREYSSYMAALARRGYVVIKPDLRGHDQSWGVANGAYFDPGYATDVLNLSGSLEHYPSVDGGLVGLFGHSMGGYVALEAATVEPRRFRAAVLMAPAAGELTDMYYHWRARSELDNPQALAARKRLIDLFGDPQHNPNFWYNVSPLNHLAVLQTVVQTHHGLADSVVPPRFSEQLHDALTRQHRTVESFTYPGAGHAPVGATQGQIIGRSLGLYDRYLHR